MRIGLAIPERHVSAPVLEAALEATTRAGEDMIRAGEVGLAADAIGSGRVRWKPEPPNTPEAFDVPIDVEARGWGDCDDLAPWHAASLRATGEDPGARARVVRSGPRTWHAIVERSDGSHDDPSLAAGMPRSGRVAGPVPAPLRPGRTVVRWGPSRGAWAARCDLPALPGGSAVVGVAHATHLDDAIESAAARAMCVGLYGTPDIGQAARLATFVRSLHESPDRVIMSESRSLPPELIGSLADAAAAADPIVVGFGFGSIFRGIRRAAQGAIHAIAEVDHAVAQAATSAVHAIPGIGPAAARILHAALAPTDLALHAADEVAHGGAVLRALHHAGIGLVHEAARLAPIAADIIKQMPGVGQLGAAAITAASVLAEGRPVTDALLAAAREALPDIPGAREAFDAGVHALHADASPVSIDGVGASDFGGMHLGPLTPLALPVSRTQTSRTSRAQHVRSLMSPELRAAFDAGAGMAAARLHQMQSRRGLPPGAAASVRAPRPTVVHGPGVVEVWL